MSTTNPFRPDAEEVDLHDPAERMKLLVSVRDNIEEAVTKIALSGGGDPIDLIVEALAGVYAIVDCDVAALEAASEGADL